MQLSFQFRQRELSPMSATSADDACTRLLTHLPQASSQLATPTSLRNRASLRGYAESKLRLKGMWLG
jgi:hypothetical protein